MDIKQTDEGAARRPLFFVKRCPDHALEHPFSSMRGWMESFPFIRFRDRNKENVN
ncbi:hypothetical protein TGS27_0719 [Geobacillus stearothermophilus]|uniref:Uncharacterized protein n=1 Tax=Geobacillus stearothermophilus TaxID=1422 RepID=A0A150NAY1_GEOSE|nr:hypothetical protein GS8_1030 [Geobacillus stearothermophilus]KYD22417.1 hypothetical protein B4109_1336 [Geobacillus stearothermophilus]KYD33873.1 hypothetical protein B4114_1299 [Geobacillus stearothermophilus]OAO85404.1 hypothetical protein TGS27_0719 [Geobacillus stearothermophilus]